MTRDISDIRECRLEMAPSSLDKQEGWWEVGSNEKAGKVVKTKNSQMASIGAISAPHTYISLKTAKPMDNLTTWSSKHQ